MTKFSLPDLPFDYGDLAPWVSADTMRAHHDHHHQTYTDKFNGLVEKLPTDLQPNFTSANQLDAAENLLRHLDELPAEMRGGLKNQGGGFFNHSLFWRMLTPHGDGQPTGKLGAALTAKYGDFQTFADQFEATATGWFGSGWAWLTADLDIVATGNQDLPGSEVLFGLDLWEHAYYLDYKWNRADYVKAWWPFVNWQAAAARWTNLQK
ncbi:MAG: superoxide dismutase [Candidatus Nomurabacteria bacterium]|jgi:Fe-Mn family superoxide dismutase|nr:superoxide dismutase [Candidatus Nomurabacteria bacterium]